MSWSGFRRFTRTLGFRLNIWYGAIFLVSVGFVFALVYFLLSAAIDRKDRDVIEARLREYVAVYHGGGIPALSDWTARVNQARKELMFFVRVTSPNGTAQFLAMPQDWTNEDLHKIGSSKGATQKHWTRVPRNREIDLTVASAILHDGSLFQLGRSSDSRSTLLARFRQAFAVAIPPVLLIGFIGGAFLTQRMTRPVRHLGEAVLAILNTGRMDVRVSEQAAEDELQELVLLFNRMLAHNEALFRVLRDSLDNVAHELRTPLSRLRVSLENSLQKNLGNSPIEEEIADALDETERVQTIIRTLMDVALAESGLMRLNLARTDLRSLLDDVFALYEHVALDKDVHLDNRVRVAIEAEIDAPRMRQAFANLLDNAIKYTPAGGHVSVVARKASKGVEVAFRDTGPGISTQDLPRIWDRLYRSSENRNEPGLGLGLSLVKAIVEAHGGRIEIRSIEGKGSEFRVFLVAQSEGTFQRQAKSGKKGVNVQASRSTFSTTPLEHRLR